MSLNKYIDLKAAPLDQFPNIKDLSLNKYIKCIRNEIKTDPGDVSKINFIEPIHKYKLYIPLIKREEKRALNLDLGTFPRSVQKAWQNAYELEYNIKPEDILNLTYGDPQFISLNMFKLHLNRDLILLNNTVETMKNKKDKFQRDQYLHEDYEEIRKKLDQLKVMIQSVKRTEFLLETDNYPSTIRNYILKAEDSIIICSNEISSDSISFFSEAFSELKHEKINIILIFNKNTEGKEDISTLKDQFSEKMAIEKGTSIHLIRSVFSLTISNVKRKYF